MASVSGEGPGGRSSRGGGPDGARAVTVEDRAWSGHIPVLLDHVLDGSRSVPTVRRIVDCTVGGAGHASELLKAFPEASLLGVDRDREALAAAGARLAEFGDRASLVHGRCSDVAAVCAAHGWAGTVDVVLADFGVSSHQIDNARRGFSFRMDGSLDMRMDPESGESALTVLKTIDAVDLKRALKQFGEERYAGPVARAMVAEQPQTTAELAALVRKIVPRSRDGIDAATRTFQGLRMLVNDELGEVRAWARDVGDVLAPDGVALAISFHSGEDRAVKQTFAEAVRSCTCPPGLPVCLCGTAPTVAWGWRGTRTATDDEARANPRARSAKLRCVRKLRPEGTP